MTTAVEQEPPVAMELAPTTSSHVADPPIPNIASSVGDNIEDDKVLASLLKDPQRPSTRPDSVASSETLVSAEVVSSMAHHANTVEPVDPVDPVDMEDQKSQQEQSVELGNKDGQSCPEELPLWDIQPDHFYDGGGIPVFRPTAEQFRDFYRFVKSINKYGMEAGIVKVIPPAEWKERLPLIEVDRLASLKVESAIRQHTSGSGGVYTIMNVESRKAFSVHDWKTMCVSDQFRTPSIEESGVSSNAKRSKRKRTSLDSPSSSASTSARPQTRPRKEANEPSEEALAHIPSPTVSPEGNSLLVDTPPQKDVPPLKVWSYEDLYPDEKFPSSLEYFSDLERCYWKNLTFNPPFYGADIEGTLFPKDWKEWNVARLDNLLNRMTCSLPGVNTPYLYFGMWKATFSWHLEDMDLYSINYIHYGAPKQWYSIPQKHRGRFERMAQSAFAHEYQDCTEFLRHKTFLFSPYFINKHSIPVYKCVQEEGEFVITFPYGYHAGYNLGYNCAESINFATDDWMEIGRRAKACECVKDSVRINVDTMFNPIEHTPEPEPEPEVAPVVKAAVAKKSRVKEKPKLCILCGLDESVQGFGDFLEVKPAPSTTEEPAETPAAETVTVEILTPSPPKKVQYAHRLCAEYVPEVYIERLQQPVEMKEGSPNVETMVDRVANVHAIERSRWKLRCKYCRRKGACIQCCKGTCITAFHVTCAHQHGLLLQKRQVVLDGKVMLDIAEGFCPRHDPNGEEQRKRNVQAKVEALMQGLDAWLLQPAESRTELAVWARWSDGKYYAGTVEEDFRERQACRVIFWDGYQKMTGYAEVELERPRGAIGPDDLVEVDVNTVEEAPGHPQQQEELLGEP